MSQNKYFMVANYVFVMIQSINAHIQASAWFTLNSTNYFMRLKDAFNRS